MRRILAHETALLWLSCGYAGCVVAWLILLGTPLAAWWPISTASALHLGLYAPIPVLGLLALARRSPRAAIWLLLPLLLFVGEYAPDFLPKRDSPTGRPLRVLTANLHVENASAERVAGAFLAEKPDVIAVQELGGRVAPALSELLSREYPHQALYPRALPSGMGIFSRYPVLSTALDEMAPGSCSCQAASLDFAGRPIAVLNVHPAPPSIRYAHPLGVGLPIGLDPGFHEESLRVILDRADAAREPLLVVGDLNLADRQPFYRVFSRQLGDAHREAGWGLGYTYPSDGAYGLPLFPLARIDYVLHDRAWAASSVTVRATPGSDHRSVVADLVLLDQ